MSINSNSSPALYKWLTWLMRLLVGATFIFSGFVKAIDPWGTFYKFQDYIGVLGLDVTPNLLIAAVFALCAYEFCTGIFLFFGCYRRSAPIAAMLLMIVMLPLTLWIALKNPVADCGCFGDALIISNWATFWKNVVLVVAIAWLIKFNKISLCLIRPYVQWLALVVSGLFIVAIGLVGYIYQPLIDFRPFPIGTDLVSHLDSAGEASLSDENSEFDTNSVENDGEGESATDNLLFIYSKDGVEKAFRIDDDLPDESEGWVFVRREENIADAATVGTDRSANDIPANEESDSALQLWSEAGDEEMTAEAITANGGEILLLMPDLKSVSMAETWKINSLYQWAGDNNINMIGIVAGSSEDIENWKDISLAGYPLYTAEDTQIKMLARGNPAVVFLMDGVIKWKSSLRALFTEDFQSADTTRDPSRFFIDNKRLLLRAVYTYLTIMAFLIAFSFLPMIARFFPDKMEKSINSRNEKINNAEKKMEQKKMEHFNQSASSDVVKKNSL